MKKIKIMTIIAFIVFAMSQCKKCEYTNCADSCMAIEDFNDGVLNWEGVDQTDIEIDSLGQLTASSGVDTAYIYNTTSFPTNLAEAGCAMKYEVYHKIQGFNESNTGIVVFSGATPATSTQTAQFILNPGFGVAPNSSIPTTVIVPLSLASGITLPSNTSGTWYINGGAPYSNSDISDFNTLIQNIGGIAHSLSDIGEPETWIFDNFCITDCCNEEIQID